MFVSGIGFEQDFGCIIRATPRFQDIIATFFAPDKAVEILLDSGSERVWLEQFELVVQLLIFHWLLVGDFDKQPVADEIASAICQHGKYVVRNLSETDRT